MRLLVTIFLNIIFTFSIFSEDINSNWLFTKTNTNDPSFLKDKETDWSRVQLPHTFTPSGSPEVYRDHLTDVLYSGSGWYQKEMFFEPSLDKKRVFLRFGAAYLETDLYVNGMKVGNHKGGYSAFIFEITDYIKLGSNNKITVHVCNKHTDTVLPLGGGYVKFGGITRPMSLIIKDKLCISPLHFASSGVYIKQNKVNEEQAELEVKTVLNTKSSDLSKYTLVTTFYDPKGDKIAHSKKNYAIPQEDQWFLSQKVVIKKPQLWKGAVDPALYKVKVELFNKNELLDQVTVNTGIRNISVDKDKGFYLNGISYPLRGVAQHEYFPVVGSAMHKEHYQKDMELIQEIGANSIRLSHYPHGEYRYELCDEKGIIVFTEMAMIKQFYGTPEFIDNAAQQLQEMVYQLYNHPSVVMWGLYNEIRFDTYSGYNGLELVNKLNDLAKTIDPSRPTVGVSWLDGKRSDIPDLSGWNRYQGWYWDAYPGSPANFTWIDDMRDRHPNRILGLTEYGAGGSIKHFDENRNIAPYNGDQFHPVDFYNYSHEQQFKGIANRPWLWCSFVWTLSEFLCPGYDQGSSALLHDKGLISENRKVKKDVFYFYKANWRPEEPVFHLAYKQYDIRMKDHAQVTVYSNMDSVSLYVNGQYKGVMKNADYAIYRWDNIPLSLGENEILVRTHHKGKLYEEKATWFRSNGISSSSRIKEIIPISDTWDVSFYDQVFETKKQNATGIPGEEINNKFTYDNLSNDSTNIHKLKLPLFTDTRPFSGNWNGAMVYMKKEFTVDSTISAPHIYLLHTAQKSRANEGRISIAIDDKIILTLDEGSVDDYRLISIADRINEIKPGKHKITVMANKPHIGRVDIGLVEVVNSSLLSNL